MTVYKVEKDGGSFRICFSINVEREIETDTNSFPCETILTLSALLELKCLDLLRYFSYYFGCSNDSIDSRWYGKKLW